MCLLTLPPSLPCFSIHPPLAGWLTGVALAKEKLTAPPGFLTPAAALGHTLIERFAARNLEIKLHD